MFEFKITDRLIVVKFQFLLILLHQNRRERTKKYAYDIKKN